MDFPVLYASAKEGWASLEYTKSPPEEAKNMSDLLDTIIRHVPPPTASLDAPFQMLVGICICISRNDFRLCDCISHLNTRMKKVEGLEKS